MFTLPENEDYVALLRAFCKEIKVVPKFSGIFTTKLTLRYRDMNVLPVIVQAEDADFKWPIGPIRLDRIARHTFKNKKDAAREFFYIVFSTLDGCVLADCDTKMRLAFWPDFPIDTGRYVSILPLCKITCIEELIVNCAVRGLYHSDTP